MESNYQRVINAIPVIYKITEVSKNEFNCFAIARHAMKQEEFEFIKSFLSNMGASISGERNDFKVNFK